MNFARLDGVGMNNEISSQREHFSTRTKILATKDVELREVNIKHDDEDSAQVDKKIGEK